MGDPSPHPGATGLAYFDVPSRHDPDVLALSPAERAVLRLVVRGSTNDVIAWARASSTRTVANQVGSLLAKTGATSRHELSARYGDVALTTDGTALSVVRAASATEPSTHRLILVEDDDDARVELAALFESRQFEVTAASSIEDARRLAVTHRFDVAVLDMRLPDGSANSLIREFGIPTVLISGAGSYEEVAYGLALGASEFVAKSAPLDVLLAAVHDATLRGEQASSSGLSTMEFRAMQPLSAAAGRERVLRGELRCIHVSDWPGYRRVALEPTASLLSDRTSAVARAVANGLLMKQVADRVGVSEATAWLEIRHFLHHSGLADRLQVARLLGPLAPEQALPTAPDRS